MEDAKFCRVPADLSEREVQCAVDSFLMYYSTTAFEERDVDVTTGLTFGIEQLACCMGLISDLPYEDSNYDSNESLCDLLERMDKFAQSNDRKSWVTIRPYLPFLRSLDVAQEQ